MDLTQRNSTLTGSGNSLLASVESVQTFRSGLSMLIFTHLQHCVYTWPNSNTGLYMDSGQDTYRKLNAIWIPDTYLEVRRKSHPMWRAECQRKFGC